MWPLLSEHIGVAIAWPSVECHWLYAAFYIGLKWSRVFLCCIKFLMSISSNSLSASCRLYSRLIKHRFKNKEKYKIYCLLLSERSNIASNWLNYRQTTYENYCCLWYAVIHVSRFFCINIKFILWKVSAVLYT